MDATERFLHDRNLARFVERLETEPEAQIRGALRDQLVAEEDCYAAELAALDTVDDYIARGEARIAALSRPAGHGACAAERAQLLANCRETLALFKGYRAKLVAQSSNNPGGPAATSADDQPKGAHAQRPKG